MNFRNVLIVALLAVASLWMNAQSKTAPQPQNRAPQTNTLSGKEAPASEGERVFKQNCSRCHNAPEGFSPNIAGTIVRHMRVRANLSEHDTQTLMKFFNP